MFSAEHFIWIAICTAQVAVLLYLSLKLKFSHKTATRIMAIICIASELCKIFTHIQVPEDGGGVLEPGALPLHLCSILIFLIFYCACSDHQERVCKVTSFCLPVAIWGGSLAILMATSGTNFREPYAYQCFLFHGALLWWALYLLVTKQVELGRRAYLQNLSVMTALLFVMIWVNSALSVYNTNFFYLVRPPVDGLPLLNLDHGWYVYFLTIVVLGFAAITLVHLPAMLKERRCAE